MNAYKIVVRRLSDGTYEASCGIFGAVAATENQAIRLVKKFVIEGERHIERPAGGHFDPQPRLRR